MSTHDKLLQIPVTPDYEGLKANLLRKGTPERVFVMELFQDVEIKDEICKMFGVGANLDKDDTRYLERREIEVQRFLGYDALWCNVDNLEFPHTSLNAEDTTEGSQKREARGWVDEHSSLISNWEEFEKYPWPDPKSMDTTILEWYSKNMPEGMGIYSGCHSVFENVTWLMGYETLCYAIYDQPDLVDAMFERIGSILHEVAKVLVQIPRVDILFGGDDMGYKTGTMISADILKEKSLCWHKKNAQLAHENGRLYLLHACGNLEELMETLIEDVKLDGKHSFEDVIEPLPLAKQRWGDRLSLIGGIDVDFLCRASEEEIRKRVREVVDACQPGGGFCLGSGNTVANYVPVRNYLVMLDEGRKCR